MKNTIVPQNYWVIMETARGLNQVISKLAHSGNMEEAYKMIEVKKEMMKIAKSL